METVVRHLTFSERRLREAERRAAESARRKTKDVNEGVAASGEAAALPGGGERVNDAARQRKRPARGSVGDAAVVGYTAKATEISGRYVHGSSGEESCFVRTSPSRPCGSEIRRHRRKSRTNANEDESMNHAFDGFVGERQQHGDTLSLQENRDPAGGLTVAFGFTASDNEDTANTLREVEAARRQVAVAEQQAVALRVDANRVKVEAAKMAAEAEIGKERAMMESERLGRELKATEIEVSHARAGADVRSACTFLKGTV